MKLKCSVWKARMGALIVGVLSFFLYVTTSHDGFFPGESAHHAAVTLGAEPGSVSGQYVRVHKYERQSVGSQDRQPVFSPKINTTLTLKETTFNFHTRYIIWRLFSKCALLGDMEGIANRLNLFSALCGAFCLAFAFSLFRATPLFFAFHISPLSANQRKRSALIAAIAGTVSLATSVPFWLSSTRFLPHPFEALLFILTAWSLLCATIRHSLVWLVLSGFLLGLSLFETSAGLLFLPLWVFLFIGAMRVGGISDARGNCGVLLGVVSGGLVYMFAAHSILTGEVRDLSLTLPLVELGISVKHIFVLVFGGGFFESQKQMIYIFLSVLPFLSALAMMIWRNSASAVSSGGVLLFVLTIASSIALLKTDFSPWGVCSDSNSDKLPVFIFVMNAFVVSFLAAQGAFMAGGRFFSPKSRRHKGHARAKECEDCPVGRLLMIYILVFSVGIGIWNFREVRDWRDTLTVCFAKEFTENMGDCRWVISGEETPESLIKIFSKLNGKPITMFCPHDEDTNRQKMAFDSENSYFVGLNSQLLLEALNRKPATFVQTWFELDSGITNKVVAVESLDFTESGHPAIPNVVCYQTVVDEKSLDWEMIAERHLAFWERLAQVEPLGSNAPFWLRRLRARLRENLSNVGVSLATALLQNDLPEKAALVNEAARKVRNEPNTSEILRSNTVDDDLSY